MRTLHMSWGPRLTNHGPPLILPAVGHWEERVNAGQARQGENNWYADVVSVLKQDMRTMKSWPASRRVGTVRKAVVHFEVWAGELMRREDRGLSLCVLPDKVDAALSWGHALHGHYGLVTTLGRLMGKFWWPTRHKDVETYIRQCGVSTSNVTLLTGARTVTCAIYGR